MGTSLQSCARTKFHRKHSFLFAKKLKLKILLSFASQNSGLRPFHLPSSSPAASPQISLPNPTLAFHSPAPPRARNPAAGPEHRRRSLAAAPEHSPRASSLPPPPGARATHPLSHRRPEHAPHPLYRRRTPSQRPHPSVACPHPELLEICPRGNNKVIIYHISCS